MADEKTFIVPLRKEFQKAPKYRRTKRAVNALRTYLKKHLKTDNFRIGKSINLKMWEHGIKNPPHKVKISVAKDEKGVFNAELFGVKIPEKAKGKEAKKEKEHTEEKQEKKAEEK